MRKAERVVEQPGDRAADALGLLRDLCRGRSQRVGVELRRRTEPDEHETAGSRLLSFGVEDRDPAGLSGDVFLRGEGCQATVECGCVRGQPAGADRNSQDIGFRRRVAARTRTSTLIGAAMLSDRVSTVDGERFS